MPGDLNNNNKKNEGNKNVEFPTFSIFSMVRDSNHNNNKEGSQGEESPIFSFFSILTAWNNTNIFPIF